MENRNLKKNSKNFLKNFFSSNTCLIILGALSVVKISARLDLPSSISRKVQKEGGGTLKNKDLSYLDKVVIILPA